MSKKREENPPPNKTGILLVNKPKWKTSFSLIGALRKASHIRTIGHAGTLDPFATGVMILLIGKAYTRLSNQFINKDKEYQATLELGKTTTTFDPEGDVVSTSDLIPSKEELTCALSHFQGTTLQTPPMFSAKKVQGTPLYKLARLGKVIERKAQSVTMHLELIEYTYPHVVLNIYCSKGTYIRSLAHDLGEKLGCGAYLKELVRTACGPYRLEECLDGTTLFDGTLDYSEHVLHV